MYFILSTIPNKKYKHKRKVKKLPKVEDKIIRYCLVTIWALLIVFGVITLIQPTWLQSISNPGRDIEADNFRNMGDYALKHGNYKAAIHLYTQALKVKPDMAEAHINLAITYSKMREYDKAIFIFKEFLKQESRFSYVIYYNLAEIYENIGDIDKAIVNYTKSAEAVPYAINRYQKIGKLHLKRKEWDLAINAFQKALDNKFDIETAYRGMLKKALHTYSTHPEITEIINELLLQEDSKEIQKHYDSTLFQKMLDKDIELAKIHNNIGYAYFMKGNLQNAISHFRMSLKIWPGYKHAKNNLKTAIAQEKGEN